jgi:hypothetical protein
MHAILDPGPLFSISIAHVGASGVCFVLDGAAGGLVEAVYVLRGIPVADEDADGDEGGGMEAGRFEVGVEIS